MMRRLAAFVFMLGCPLVSCSHSSSSPEQAASSAEAYEGRSQERGAFGSRCHADSECNSGGVCFHRKKAKEGKEGDEGERGHCTMACGGDSDCKSPPTSGHCNPKKKICTRVRGQHGNQPSPPGEPSDEEIDDS